MSVLFEEATTEGERELYEFVSLILESVEDESPYVYERIEAEVVSAVRDRMVNETPEEILDSLLLSLRLFQEKEHMYNWQSNETIH